MDLGEITNDSVFPSTMISSVQLPGLKGIGITADVELTVSALQSESVGSCSIRRIDCALCTSYTAVRYLPLCI